MVEDEPILLRALLHLADEHLALWILMDNVYFLAQLMSCKFNLSLCDDLLSGVYPSVFICNLWWHKSTRLELESPYVVCRYLG